MTAAMTAATPRPSLARSPEWRDRGGSARTSVFVVVACAALATVAFGCHTRTATAPAPPTAARRDDGTRVDPSIGRAHVPYVVVGPRGTRAFAHPPDDPRDPSGGVPVGAGFGFVVTGEQTLADGRRFVRIRDGRWLAAADVTRARLSSFAGLAILADGATTAAWVAVDAAAVRRAPTGGPASGILASLPRRARVALAGPCRAGFCRAAGGWILSDDLVVAVTAPRPTGVAPLERWIDVDLTTQVLVAYIGDRPVYATLISSGIGEPDTAFATPTGLFRIRSKHELARMDNLAHTDVVPYAYDVPLVQYFSAGKALHAALWHDRFGQPTSHGCISLAPHDAEWLFAFTTPAPSNGQTDIDATSTDPGTWIRVRGRARDVLTATAPPNTARSPNTATATGVATLH